MTKFIFHKNNILAETDKDYNVISRFTRGYEVVAADIAGLGEGLEASLNRYYYTADEQCSTVFITDKNQQVKNEYYYDSFGNVLDSKEQVHNRITYAGQQFDGITGQYYLRSRFYNPVISKFTQEDIYRGDGLNLYAYFGNNPIAYYDPSGYEKLPSDDRVVWAIDEDDKSIQDALKGIKSGERGNSFAVLKGATERDKKTNKLLEEHGLKGIWYTKKDGKSIPDFDPVSMFNVKIPNMTEKRQGLGKNYDQTREAIASEIIKSNGNINILKENGIVNSKVTNKTLGEVNDFLDNKAKEILNKDLPPSERLSQLKKEIAKLEYKNNVKVKTVHEKCNPDAQLVPTNINGSFSHDGGVSECKNNNTKQCINKGRK